MQSVGLHSLHSSEEERVWKQTMHDSFLFQNTKRVNSSWATSVFACWNILPQPFSNQGLDLAMELLLTFVSRQRNYVLGLAESMLSSLAFFFISQIILLEHLPRMTGQVPQYFNHFSLAAFSIWSRQSLVQYHGNLIPCGWCRAWCHCLSSLWSCREHSSGDSEGFHQYVGDVQVY